MRRRDLLVSEKDKGDRVMYVQVTPEEIRLTRELVRARIKEIEAEVDRDELADGSHELSQLWQQLERLLHRLHEADCDVLA